MKKRVTKVLAGMVAVVMVLASLTVDWGSVMEAEAAEEINQNLLAGDVLCDVDFMQENIFDLDDRFVATEDTTDSVYQYWQNGEAGTTVETTNVALNGTVDMESMPFIEKQDWYDEGLLVDGINDNSQRYVSTDYITDGEASETITVTFRNKTYYKLSKVSFTTHSTKGIPEDFIVQVHVGNEEWVTVAKETGYNTAGEWNKDIVPIVGNAVRLTVTKFGLESASTTKRVLQLRELEAYGTTCSNVALNGAVSMNSGQWIQDNTDWYDEAKLTDGKKENGNTYVTTEEPTDSPYHTETITVTFSDNTYYDINKVVFSPRDGSRGIPEDFIVEVGNGTTWNTVAEVTGYTTTGDWTSIGFVPVKGNAVRITATKLGSTGSKYGLQLRELEAYGWKSVNAASGGSATITTYNQIGDWAGKTYDPTTRLLNGIKSGNDEFGSSKFYGDGGDHNESATVSFANGAFYEIEKIVLYPAVNANGTYGGGFPKDFTVKVWTGTKWKPITSKTDYSSGTSALDLDVEPTMCNAILIEATELDVSNDGKNYAFHLSEVEAFGEPVPLLRTRTSYNSANPTTTLLSLKDVTVENFKAEIEMLNFDNTTTQYGVYFGHAAYDSTEGAVYPEINLPTTTVGDFITLNIEVISDEMKLWWNGFEDGVQTVALPEPYDGGYFTLFSTGNDQGGFKSLKIQEYFVRQGADADLAGAELEALNEKFVSYRGITGTNGTKANSVAEHWSLDDTTVGRINVAHEKGTPSISDEQASYAPKSALNDDNTGNFAGTKNYGQADVADGVYATVEFDGNYKIDAVEIHWRRTDEQPETVELQALIGTSWITVAIKDSYESTWTPSIPTTVCKGIRLKATKLQYFDNGYWLRVKEMRAFGVPTTNAAIGGTAEMNVMFDGVKADYLKDGEPYGSSFASTNYVGEYDKQEATVIFNGKNYHEISHIRVFPRSNKTGFPVDFTISIWNGKEWVLATEKFTDYDVTKTGHLSVDIEPLVGNAIKIEATRLGSTYDKGTKYALQLAEIEAWGQPVDLLTTNTASSEGYTSMLTWKDMKVKNFKAEIELMDYDTTTTKTSYGLYFGQSDYGVVEEGVIYVAPRSAEAGGIIIGGSAGIDATSVSCVSDAISKNFNQNVAGKNVRPKFSISDFKVGTYDISHVLNVEVIDGIIKVWWTGHEEAAWTVEMLPEYYETYKNEGGYVSVFSTGNDLGGIKSMKMQEIIDEEIEVNVDMNVETFGDYAVVNVSNDIAGGILKDSALKGNLKYDSRKYEYCTTVIEDKGAELYANLTEKSTGESVAIDLTSYSKAAVAKLYFKNLTGAYDYTGFSLDVDSVTRAKSSKSAQATTLETVTYDYTGENGKADKIVDARDLVRSVKEYETSQEVREVLIGVPNDWVTAITGEQQSVVYVNAETGSDTGAGTKESPLSSLLLAGHRVADGGTIHVEGNYTFGDTEKTIGMGEKHITVTGTNAVLDITTNGTLGLRGDVTLSGAGVTLKTDGNDSIYANGHEFTIDKDVVFDGKLKFLYGGNNNGRPLERTELNINAGDYELIFGGSNNATSVRCTNVTVGGNTNTNLESQTGSQLLDCVYGGGNYGVVTGDTNVKITGDAKINIVFGGGYSTASYVYGTCNVTIEGGDTMGYYGGSYEGFNHKTKIVMTGGKAAQIFGGNWHSSMLEEGSSTLIQLDGGEVTRRIYGGCYNDVDDSLNWTEWNYVNGTTKVVINADVYSGSSWKPDCGICAGSRLKKDTNGTAGVEAEASILQFATQALYNKYISRYIGSDDLSSIPKYDQCYIGEDLVP